MNGTEIYKFKAKNSEIVASPLCLGNISKDSEIVASPLCLGNISNYWSADSMKKTGFNRYVYDFSVD